MTFASQLRSPARRTSRTEDRTTCAPSRRALLAAATGTAALGLASCGIARTAGEESASGGPGSSEVAIGGAGFDTADAETAKLGTDAKPGVFPRTVTHAMGTTEIAARPVRVAVLDQGEADQLLALGITPVAIAVTEGANPVPAHLAGRLAGAAHVGTIKDISLEAVAKAKPDLILSSRLRHEKLYDQLTQIAPTVMSIRPGFPWKENLRLTAAAVGAEEKATATLSEYSKRAEAIRSAHDGSLTVSMLRFMPGKIRLYGNKSLVGVILRDCGLKRPPKQDIDDLAAEISAESIGEADGGLLLYSSYGDPAATGEAGIVQGRAWKAIPAVQEGRAHRVEDGTWFLGLGPIGAARIMDELEELIRA